MMRQEKRFPLVADDEVVVGDNPIMSLYDESDLISNIKGPYQEKDFSGFGDSQKGNQSSHSVPTEDELLPPLFEAKTSQYSRKERLQRAINVKPSYEKTQGQLARELAKRDLKRKQSANFLREDKLTQAKVLIKPQATEPTESKVNKLSRLADNLRQVEYILADMPATYSLKKEDRSQEQNYKKNSYDFLKKSQVYNYPERQQQKVRQIAQELNLTNLGEE